MSKIYEYMKFISIFVLVIQHVSLVLVMHYSGIAGTYLTTTVVVCVESVKLITSLIMVRRDSHGSDWMTVLRKKVFHKPIDFLKTGVPGILYVVQNNLQFVAVKNLSAAEYIVMFQLKIPSTAILSWLILRKTLSSKQWAALILLFFGAALVETPSAKKNDVTVTQPDGTNHLLGIVCVLLAVTSSGLAGVLTEKLLKDTQDSIWVRNIQLSIFGLVFGLIGALIRDGAAIMEGGFFQGYDLTVVIIIALHALGGLTVAMLLKYGDNILKCFAGAFGLVLTYICQRIIEPEAKSLPFFMPGACIIVGAVPIYMLNPVETSALGLEYKMKTRYKHASRGYSTIQQKERNNSLQAEEKNADDGTGAQARDEWESGDEATGEDFGESVFGNRRLSWFNDEENFKEAI